MIKEESNVHVVQKCKSQVPRYCGD